MSTEIDNLTVIINLKNHKYIKLIAYKSSEINITNTNRYLFTYVLLQILI